MLRTQFSTLNPPSPKMPLVSKQCKPEMLTFGDPHQVITAQPTTSTVVREMLLPLVITSTQSNPLDWDQSTHSNSNMVELKSKLRYPRVIGFGPPFGSYQLITSTDNGPLLERSTSWNLGVMIPHIQQVAMINLPPLCTGDQTGHTMPMLRLIKSINTLNPSPMTSTSLDCIGMRTNYTPILMMIQRKS